MNERDVNAGRGQRGGGRGARGAGRGGGLGMGRGGGQPPQGYQRPSASFTQQEAPKLPKSEPTTSYAEYTAVGTASGTTSELRELTMQLGGTSLRQEPKLPPRPGFGKKGRPIKLISNFYPIQIPDKNIYQYDITITPDGIVARKNRRILEAWKKLPSHNAKQIEFIRLIVYDGQKTFYCPGKLNLGKTSEMSWDIELNDEDDLSRRVQKFNIKIQETTIVQMERLHQYLTGRLFDIPRDAIAVIEILMRQRPSTVFASKITKSGTSFFQLHDRNAVDLGGGLVVQQGWYQAARPTIKQLLMLNLDVSATSFYKPGPLLDVVCNFLGVRAIKDIRQDTLSWNKDKLEKFLCEVNINTTHRATGRKKYKINGLSDYGANKQLMKIPIEDTITEGSPYFGQDANKQVTVAQYYQKMFNVKLSYAYFPVILSGTKKQIHIPMELCHVRENQRYINKNMNEPQLANMIKITATNPQERFRKIEVGRTQLHSEKEQIAMLQSWDVTISPNPQELTGRILDSPHIAQGTSGTRGGRGSRGGGRGGAGSGGGASSVTNPNNGVWRLDSFYKPAELTAWSVLVLGDSNNIQEDNVHKFTSMLSQQMQLKGMKVTNWKPDVVYKQNNLIRQALIEANRYSRPNGSGGSTPGKRAELILVILVDKLSYSEVKRVAEVDLGLMTQCCLMKYVDKASPAYCGNLALKINVKLGGINNVLVPDGLQDVKQVAPQMNSRIMIFGADVTHPTQQQQQKDPNAKSIAAITASIDKNFWDYRAAVRTQTGKLEIINDVTDMVSGLIGHYRQNNQGQLPNRILFYRDGVSEGQFAAVLFNELPMIREAFAKVTKELPKITFIIINKRHHARFLPKDPQDGDRKSGNIPAGTVIDNDVTHPYEFDFFLTSHAGLQGTSKPSHYHVLFDENGFSADELQQVTNHLCYLFNRCSRSVSMVPAAYYAHLVAARARCHAGISEEFSETKVSSIIKNRMYFA